MIEDDDEDEDEIEANTASRCVARKWDTTRRSILPLPRNPLVLQSALFSSSSAPW